MIDEKDQVIGLSYFFKGTRIKTYRFDGSALVESDPDILSHIPSLETVQFTAYFHTEDKLQEGYGIPLISPFKGGGDDYDVESIGARKRPRKPDGESSIALELPKQSEEVDP